MKPARSLSGVKVQGIASRKFSKALIYAVMNRIPKSYGSYEKLLLDPNIDAVYNPLPNGLHAEWSMRVLEAGKHVLCEKPIASNAAQATRMKKTAETSGKLLVEAFHYRYHPLVNRIREIIIDDQIGELKEMYAKFCINMENRTNDIRFDYELGGGGLMDVGCYAVNLLRYLGGEEPVVVSAKAKVWEQQIDTYLHGELKFPSGCDASLDCSLLTRNGGSDLKITGSEGFLRCRGPFDSYGNDIEIYSSKDRSKPTRVEKIRTGHKQSTYYFQLNRFMEALLEDGKPMETDINDAIANMRVIDALYKEVGLKPRGN